MNNFIGYFYGLLENFYSYFGTDENPAEGTENYIKGFDSTKSTKRYTKPVVHPDSSCSYDDNDMPIAPITGTETNIVAAINSDCSQTTLDKLGTLKTQQEVKDLGFFPVDVDDQ